MQGTLLLAVETKETYIRMNVDQMILQEKSHMLQYASQWENYNNSLDKIKLV